MLQLVRFEQTRLGAGGGVSQAHARATLGVRLTIGQREFYFDVRTSDDGMLLFDAVRRAYRAEWQRRATAAYKRRTAERRPQDLAVAREYPPYQRALLRLLSSEHQDSTRDEFTTEVEAALAAESNESWMALEQVPQCCMIWWMRITTPRDRNSTVMHHSS
jgi:hypothetical protein